MSLDDKDFFQVKLLTFTRISRGGLSNLVMILILQKKHQNTIHSYYLSLIFNR